MYFSTAVVAAFAATVYGATQQVLVGSNNQLTFTPNNIQAQPGDQVMFVFANANHTATQGTMNAACQPAAGGFASGFAPVNNNPTNPATIQGKLVGNAFLVQGKKTTAANTNNNNQQLTNGQASFTVNVADTNPIPVYCNQQLHCQQGMVAMINGNAQQLAQYQAMAAQAKANVIATGPANGNVTGYTPNLQTTTTTKKAKGKAGAAGGLAAALQAATGKGN